MQYSNITRGIFVSRPNRFIANVIINGKTEVCHVKNTGRCGELLIKGNTVYCVYSDAPTRKTKWDLVAVDRDGLLFNIDSQAPNQVFAEFAASGNFCPDVVEIRREYTYNKSRLDFMIQRGDLTQFIEIKGVTLERAGKMYFPDAPTERGIKHIQELCRARSEGYMAAICFVIQMQGAKALYPNDDTQPEFGRALRIAKEAGVELLAYDCIVTPDTLAIDKKVEVIV